MSPNSFFKCPHAKAKWQILPSFECEKGNYSSACDLPVPYLLLPAIWPFSPPIISLTSERANLVREKRK